MKSYEIARVFERTLGVGVALLVRACALGVPTLDERAFRALLG